jgi:hypothetical protein
MPGTLLFNRGCFAQVLEGPREAVERTFERIQRDPRHADVMPLEFAPVARRGFPSWSMAFVARSAPGEAPLRRHRRRERVRPLPADRRAPVRHPARARPRRGVRGRPGRVSGRQPSEATISR